VEAMSFEKTNPNSWLDLSLHPSFVGKPFDKTWYDGDLDQDLLLLRRASALITHDTPDFAPEFVVLDDCTFFAEFRKNAIVCCQLYPSMTLQGERCLFVAFPDRPDLEIRVLTDGEAAEVMRALSRKNDLTAFNEVE
jgi:hypothetical protein